MHGLTTIHAGSARQALTRLRFVAQLADVASQLPLSALNTLVSESIDIVVHCARTPLGPRVTEVIAVEDQAGGPDAAQFTVTQVFERTRPDQPLRWAGTLPVRAGRRLDAAGSGARRLLDVDALRPVEVRR